jgi:hypothetical protein
MGYRLVMRNVLACCNSTEIVEDRGELWIIKKRPQGGSSSSGLPSLIPGLLAGIVLINGLVQAIGSFAAWAAGPSETASRFSPIAAAILLLLGAILGYVALAMRRPTAGGVDAELQSAMFILASGRLLDGKRRDLAAVAEVRYRKVGQLTSSSPALALRWPTGERVIARGSPFGDSVDGLIHVLQRHGVA